MIEDIVNLIKSDIQTLAFIDKIGGIVKPMIIKKINGDATIDKTIPVCYNDTKTKCEVSDYVDYCPNTKFKSVSYFEGNELNQIDSTAKYVQYETVLRFVCWLNLPLINQTLTPLNNVPFEILEAVNRRLNNVSPFVFGRITQANIIKGSDIFSPYSYDEAENQYLIFPFDYFAVDFTVNFRVPFACINNVTLNPAICL